MIENLLFATDLDRTIIYSGKFINDSNFDVVSCVEHRNNIEVSYMLKESYELYTELLKNEKLLFVPITTRSLDQFKRIDLFENIKLAVVGNGSKILYNGKELLDWSYHVLEIKRLYDLNLSYSTLIKQLEENKKYWKKDIELVEETFLYTKIDKSEEKIVVRYLNNLLDAEKWSYTIQGEKLYILPKGITKENALSYILSNYKYIDLYGLLTEYVGNYAGVVKNKNGNYVLLLKCSNNLYSKLLTLSKYYDVTKDSYGNVLINSNLSKPKLFVAGDGKLDKGMLELGDKAFIPKGSEVLDYYTHDNLNEVSYGLQGGLEILENIKREVN